MRSSTASADYALNSVVADARMNGLADLALGRAVTYTVATPAGGAVTATVAATRLPRGVLWLVASAEGLGRDAGRRRVNVAARWATLVSLPRAPLQARGAVRLRAGIVFAADTTVDADCASTRCGERASRPPGGTVTSVDSTRAVDRPGGVGFRGVPAVGLAARGARQRRAGWSGSTATRPSPAAPSTD